MFEIMGEPNFSTMQGRREAEEIRIKEGLAERQEREKIKDYRVTLYFLGAGGPAGLGGRKTERSDHRREKDASEMMQLVGADEYELTPIGVNFIFGRRPFKTNKEALMFGKRKMSDLKSAYRPTITCDEQKGDGGVEVRLYN